MQTDQSYLQMDGRDTHRTSINTELPGLCCYEEDTPQLRMRANQTSSLFPILRPENGKDLPVVY
jgi:hypothetical protein